MLSQRRGRVRGRVGGSRLGRADVAVAEAEVRAEVMGRGWGRGGSSSGSDGLELGWAEPDGMTESGMALKGWGGGMGWDEMIKPPARHEN